MKFPYQRLVVIGTTSSGKSTMAKILSRKLNLDFIDLDALHWEANWVEAPDDIFRQRVETAISSERWAVAGNYHIVRDLIWPRADAVIWLDYPLWMIFCQLTRRTFKRWWTQELLWGTNRENLWVHFKLSDLSTIFRRVCELFWNWYPLWKLTDGESPLTDTSLLRNGLMNCHCSFTGSSECK